MKIDNILFPLAFNLSGKNKSIQIEKNLIFNLSDNAVNSGQEIVKSGESYSYKITIPEDGDYQIGINAIASGTFKSWCTMNYKISIGGAEHGHIFVDADSLNSIPGVINHSITLKKGICELKISLEEFNAASGNDFATRIQNVFLIKDMHTD